MDEFEEIKTRKLEQLKKQYMKKGNTMEKNWPDMPIEIFDVDIDATVKKYPTIVIDCWAAWCGPCRMVAPIIDELAEEMKGKIVFGKLNVDENPLASGRYHIMSIPTLLIFKKGTLVDRVVGAMPKEQLKEKLKPYQ